MNAIIAFVARYLFVLVALGEMVYLYLYHRKQWKRLLVAAIVIGGLSLLAGLGLNKVVQDPRPFVAQGFTPLIPGSSDNGFPSDHTLLLSATAAVTMIANPWAGAVGLLLAIAVGLARVYAGLHHMLDIVGSLFIVGFVAAGYLIVWMLLTPKPKKKS
ncbi:MAG TPA: phosphatase PAP2 family protein [Rectinemataceae bacterium]|nr:phosphatase PAP2 family protein [Rectinemataceae bacterium]